MTFILILLGILVLAGVLIAVAAWYMLIFGIMALATLAGFAYFLTYTIVSSISENPGARAIVGVLVILLLVGGLVYAYSKNHGR